jgi:ATP-binding protein involved in chromosome partitioning
MACIRLYSCSLCDNQEACKEDKEAHDKAIIADRMAKVKHKVLVMSNKGGVGKSTVSANLAASLAKKGYRVGIADADIHGPNIPKMFGAEGKRLKITDAGIQPYEAFNLKIASIAFLMEGADEPIVWRDVWKFDFLKQLFGSFNWGELDYLVVDLPPGTGNESITTIEFVNKVGGVVIVTTPQDVALLDSRRSVTFSKINNLPVIGIVENMAGLTCPHCGKDVEVFKIGGGERAAIEMGVPFLGRIPIDPMIAVKADSGEPYIVACQDSPVGKIFQGIVDRCDTFVTTHAVNAIA